ncbi:tannase and feruloyl esterase [Ophiobolus disseminans]|uniref:Carboxylic ester hydrolase n=1 Tax=Ophiobolus disseminans TaxID=1469910 RepID=A0A6A7A9M3_9PLEO|nr:tannase and feruloyl esterase [Ophiobolus disseminans]
MPNWSNCTPSAIPFPVVFGAEFVNIEARPVLDYIPPGPPSLSWVNHPPLPNTTVDFCNVTLTHTHPGKNDTLRTQIWLPISPEWNHRMQMAGGGGWSAGFDASTSLVYGALTDGYVASTVDGGIRSENGLSPAAWALTSPGNVNYDALQNFAVQGLIDGALATKSVIKSFYGQGVDYAYWNGCSQGGRQGYMFAQRFPDVFDGIAAAAPAINWNPLFFSSMFPQQVLMELKLEEFPHPCEYETLRQAAIAACDGGDGLIDGLIATPETCAFDPHKLVGSPANCSGESLVISKAAALAMDAVWKGARTSNGSFLWYPHGFETEVTMGIGLLASVCSNNGTCVPSRSTLFTDWIRYFIKKDPNYNLNNMTRQDWVSAFKAGKREYGSIIGTDDPDLGEFRAAGGKLLTYHGLADGLIPYGGTRDYYERVSVLDPSLRDFYRYFEAPGAAHCSGGSGGHPEGVWAALVKWVEHGVAPETLVVKNMANKERLLCPYPKKAVFAGNPSNYTAQDFVCK